LSLVERERTAFEEVRRSHRRLSARDDEDKNERRRQRKRRSLYVTLKNENLYNLYAMETMACSTTGGMNTSDDDEGKEDNKNDYVEDDFVFFDQLSIGLFMAQDSHGSAFTQNAA
jgi:hypothetical protein